MYGDFSGALSMFYIHAPYITISIRGFNSAWRHYNFCSICSYACRYMCDHINLKALSTVSIIWCTKPDISTLLQLYCFVTTNIFSARSMILIVHNNAPAAHNMVFIFPGPSNKNKWLIKPICMWSSLYFFYWGCSWSLFWTRQCLE